MTAPLVTSIYAAILAVIMIALSSHISMMRAKTNTSILDGGNKDLAVRIRRHGNFVESVPMILLLMALAELDGTGKTWLHASGILLIAGRLLHAYGLQYDKATIIRILGGMASTIAMLIMVGNIAAMTLAK
jgi:uncharacterized protein